MDENIKKVYSTDKATLGQEKTVSISYKINTLCETEVEPPKNALILTWDNKTNSWLDAGAIVDEQLKPVIMMLAQVIKQNADQEQRIKDLEDKLSEGSVE
ncbi:hypothetical protein N7O58_03285 [Enterococcus dispar]|uniref:hypothetical protein n=1 Tax=Enterococcus dispar TaxID=44009 RepID=UPI0021D452F4|nr:hypothetical protein [Enterococcus dispar]MCU7356704.1 hypothetical protein [Enterococcus dispar]